ncbi:MAG: GNAT family N-acetyltransferase [Desulfotomaculum sp.]|nr:GNAT family N-acetyltransferase [Desulfotomaculum sp.]MCL0081073.1 GNAT family N-acetyltransferase [Peptococcaceae bacterium]
MMLKAMDLAKEKQCYKIMLSSNKNRLQAHQFYRQMGFEQHGFSFMTGLL